MCFSCVLYMNTHTVLYCTVAWRHIYSALLNSQDALKYTACRKIQCLRKLYLYVECEHKKKISVCVIQAYSGCCQGACWSISILLAVGETHFKGSLPPTGGGRFFNVFVNACMCMLHIHKLVYGVLFASLTPPFALIRKF